MIKEWREQQMEKLRKKDEEEENARNRLRDQAAQVSLGTVKIILRLLDIPFLNDQANIA